MTQTNQSSTINPWNGLSTYEEGEVLYGRSEEIHVLSLMIMQSHQTVLYGRSGIGKSSILKAGIFPVIRNHGVFPVFMRFDHKAKSSYLQQIIAAIQKEVDASQGKITAKALVDKSEDETLWEFFHRIEYRDADGRPIKPLIVFDQFEEIFTLEKDRTKVNKFFRQLADLINNIMPNALSDRSISAPSHSGSDSVEGMLDLGLDAFSQVSYAYKPGSDYHLVFSLREDFLHYFERYTSDIPALKNNRYCLQPINDEQAGEIILQPRPGLVDKDVARLIIEKVTKRNDFMLDGVPNIEVDSAILSLYLSRLYDKMVADGANAITADLVVAYSDNIIEGFYNEAVADLPTESVHWLEDTLINEDGRRDNRYKETVIKKSKLTKQQVDDLIENKKLLRQFSYGGELRVEFIHDVLCDVIVKHKNARAEARRLEEVKRKAKKDRRNLILKATLIASAVVIAIIGATALYLKFTENVKIIDQDQNIVISLAEDSTTVSDLNFWKATLTVTGTYSSGRDTLLLSQEISKANIKDNFTVNADSCVSMKFALDFGDFVDVGKYKNVAQQFSVAELMASPLLKLPISRDIPDMTTYTGRLLLDIAGNDIPIENAFVMLGDVVAITDSVGNFSLMLTDKPDKGVLMVAKNRLGTFELPVKRPEVDAKNHGDIVYKVLPADSLQTFTKNFEDLDSVPRWNYSTVTPAYCGNSGSQNGVLVHFTNGTTDRLKMYWKKDDIQPDKNKVRLSGYFYFAKPGKTKYTTYIGTGYIDAQKKRDENNALYRNFEFVGYDAASNMRQITGRYYTNRAGAGLYCGTINTSRKQIGTFGN